MPPRPKFSKATKFFKTVKGKKYERWFVRISFPYDDELGYKPKSERIEAGTQAEALAKARDWVPAMSEATGKLTLPKYITSTFLPEQEARTTQGTSAKRKISISYQTQQKARLTRYFLEPIHKELEALAIRRVKIASIRKPIVEEYFSMIRKLPISAEVQRQIKNDLSAVLSGVEEYLPASHRLLRKAMVINVADKKERELFKAEDIFKAILKKDAPLSYRVLLASQFFFRCRPSELFALKGSSVDLEAQEVKFCSAMRKAKRGFKPSDGSKTGEGGNRDVPLMGTLLDLFKALMEEKKTGPDEYIFDLRGKPLNNPRFSHYYWPDMKAGLGLEGGATFYSLKHLMFSYARAQGLPAEVNSMLAGHTIQGTAAHYRKLTKRDVELAYEIFESGLANAKSSSLQGGKKKEKQAVSA